MERPIGQEVAEVEVVAESAEEEENQPVPILLVGLAQSHRLFEMLQVSRSHGRPAALQE